MQGEASNSTAGVDEHVADESRGPYFPFNRRETYPPRLKVDFRRLPASVMHEVDVVLVVLGCFVQHVVLFGRSRRQGCSSNRHLSLARRAPPSLRLAAEERQRAARPPFRAVTKSIELNSTPFCACP